MAACLRPRLALAAPGKLCIVFPRPARAFSSAPRRLAQHERPLEQPVRVGDAAAPPPTSPLLDKTTLNISTPPAADLRPPSQSKSSSAPPSPPPGPPPKSDRTRWQRFRTRLGRTVLLVSVAGTLTIAYVAYESRHPPPQLDFDPELQTLVVLGNGWAATSFLKSLDTSGWNVVVISPRNYFTFTPLLPSVTVGTLNARSIIQPTRFITRHKKRAIQVYEGEAEEVDPATNTITFIDNSEIKGESQRTSIKYDQLVYAVGAENQTFGIPGVREHACFLKDIADAEKIRGRLMDCIETATFKDQNEAEKERLLHMVVVGGGPTGVEYAGELHDFLVHDLQSWYPDIAGKLKITLVEAMPKVLPMFSQQLIDYTLATFKRNHIDVLTRTSVKEVAEKHIVAQKGDGSKVEIPYGLLVWATGNTTRLITRDLMKRLGDAQNEKRGLTVNDHLKVNGSDNIWALGDCTATQYAPTAQAASQQGAYLARIFNQMAKRDATEAAIDELKHSKTPAAAQTEIDSLEKRLDRVMTFRPFHYTHQGSLAYIGSEKAIADLPFGVGNISTGGFWTMVFWRSAYLSTLFSARNRTLVVLDWLKVKFWGRDISRE